MFTYKNISKQDKTIINVGSVKAGGVIDSETEIINADLELVEQPKKESKKDA